MSTTDHHQQKDKWPVEVFRYSHSRGWELFQQGLSTTAAASSDKGVGPPQSQPQSAQRRHNPEERIMATPRRGCVEVRKLRLRIHVLNNSSSSSNSRAKDKQSHTTTMVRRRDTILLSKGDFGAVVLKFDNVSSCMAFVDRMVELNQDQVFNQNEEKKVQVRQLQRSSSLVGTSFGGSETYGGGQSHTRTGMDMDANLPKIGRAHV